jgi:hypothetical protein
LGQPTFFGSEEERIQTSWEEDLKKPVLAEIPEEMNE